MCSQIKLKLESLCNVCCKKIKSLINGAPNLILADKLPKCKLLCANYAKKFAECEVIFNIYETDMGNIFLSRCYNTELFSEAALAALLYSSDPYFPIAVFCYSLDGDKVCVRGKMQTKTISHLIPLICSAVLVDADGELPHNEALTLYIDDSLCKNA